MHHYCQIMSSPFITVIEFQKHNLFWNSELNFSIFPFLDDSYRTIAHSSLPCRCNTEAYIIPSPLLVRNKIVIWRNQHVLRSRVLQHIYICFLGYNVKTGGKLKEKKSPHWPSSRNKFKTLLILKSSETKWIFAQNKQTNLNTVFFICAFVPCEKQHVDHNIHICPAISS